jgi:putative tricarboxylic transport membrane protein
LKLSRDGCAGLVVLAASLFLFVLTLDLKPSPLVPIGPGFYPRLVLGLTVVLAAALIVFDFLKTKKPAPLARANYAAVALHFAMFAAYVIALPWVGFRIGTVAYIAVANALLEPPKNARGWLRVALLALIAGAVVYFVFEHYLTVLLPRGRWTDF